MKKITRKIICLFTSLILISLLSTNVIASENMLLNSSFTDVDGVLPVYWNTTTYSQSAIIEVDNKTQYNGQPSIKISAKEDDDARVTQEITVKPNTTYKFSAFVKTSNVSPAGNGANLAVVNTLSVSPILNGDNDWQQLSVYLISGENQTSAKISLCLGGYSAMSSGTVWFSSPTLIESENLEGVTPLSMDPNSLNSNNNSSSEPENKSNTITIVASIICVVILLIVIVFIIQKHKNKDSKKQTTVNNVSKGKSKQLQALTELPKYEKLKLTRIDAIIMVIITLVYSIFAFTNLGSTNIPETAWVASQTGEKITIDLSDTVSANRLGLYMGYGTGKYRVSYKDIESNQFTEITTFEQGITEFYIWKFADFSDFSTNQLQIEVLQHNNSEVANSEGNLLELALYYDKNKVMLEKPIKIETTNEKADSALVYNLFDEQDRVEYDASYLNGTYFDEIYHARTAYENNHEYPVYEWTHPPLGKYIISLGMRIFGENPFGWRFSGALFGVLMIPVLYLLALKIFKKRFYATCAAILLAVDFMHFSQSRISTIDVYGTFFVLLMYYLFYDYFYYKSIVVGYKKSLLILLATGIAFGLGCASKWIGVYAGGGLAILFFWSKINEYIDWKKALIQTRGKMTSWLQDFFHNHIVKTCSWCCVFFILIPIVIYSLSYVPTYLDVEGQDYTVIIKNQQSMFTYHSKTVVDSTHPFSSRWYQWPTLAKPLLAYRGNNVGSAQEAKYLETHSEQETQTYVKENKLNELSSSITIMGNPFIFWLSIIFVPLSILIAIYKKERGMYLVFVAIALQFLPWVLVERTTYIYHFFSCVPFIILCIIHVFKSLLGDTKDCKITLVTYVVICTILFLAFYPVISGLPVPKEYVDNFLLWFKYNPDGFISWPF